MAGGGWAMSLSQADKGADSGLTKDKGTDSALVAFDSIPENSRILHFGTSEEAQCILEQAGYCTDAPQTSGNTLLI